MATFDQRYQDVTTQYNAAGDIYLYAQTTPRPADPEVLAAAERQLAALPLEAIPAPAPLPPGSRMPLTRNPLFVGRADALKVLITALCGGPTMPIAAITGLGGVGKSQLAAGFVHRYGQFFAGGTFWLNFADPKGVPAEIAACGGAGYLELRPDFASLSFEEQVRLVLGAWQSPLPRLLIFDNCEETALLATWHPRTGSCRVLVTSRRAAWDPALGVQTLPLEVLPRAESVALLCRFRPELPADDATLHTIGAELGDLPLALHMAGSFLRTYRHAPFGTPTAYVAQLSQEHILEHPSLTGEGATFSPTGHEQHVARTFGVSYTQLHVADPLDARALALLARVTYFAPGELIPRDLLLATLQQTDADFQTALQNEKALARLIALGLVEEEAEGALRMHRLLTRFVRALSGDSTAQASVEDTLLDVLRQFDQAGNLVDARRLEAHLRAAADLAIPRSDEQAVKLCHYLGNYLRMAADYTSAQSYLEHALAMHEALLGKDHPETALDLNDLGYVLYYRRDYARARSYLKRALLLWEQTREYPDMAATLDNLAQLSHAQGDSVGALEHYRAALAIREQVLGPTHPKTAITLHNMGNLLLKQGDLVGARQYHERGLAIREQVFKEPNQNTAASLTSLGAVLQRQGDLPHAREYYERGLAIREQTLGPTHPYTLNTLGLLLNVLYELGDSVSARAYQDRVPVLPEKVGISGANTLNNLGYALWVRGDYAEVLRYYHEALAIFERALGKLHPNLSVALNNLGMALVPLGDYMAARAYYERALRIQQQFGKARDDLTARLFNNFGVLLRLQGEFAHARTCLEQALEWRTQVLGKAHRETATTLNNLGLLLQAEGDFTAARHYIEGALSICEQQLGRNHPDVARSLNDLGALLQAQGDLSEAQTSLEQALTIRAQALPDHPDFAVTLTNLGILAQARGDLTAARSYLQRALEINERRLGADHAATRTVRDRLVALSTPHHST